MPLALTGILSLVFMRPCWAAGNKKPGYGHTLVSLNLILLDSL